MVPPPPSSLCHCRGAEISTVPLPLLQRPPARHPPVDSNVWERWYGERWYKGRERERERQIGEREGVCGERESRSKKGKIGTTNLACVWCSGFEMKWNCYIKVDWLFKNQLYIYFLLFQKKTKKLTVKYNWVQNELEY